MKEKREDHIHGGIFEATQSHLSLNIGKINFISTGEVVLALISPIVA